MNEDFKKAVWRAVSKLSYQDRAILSLRYFNGMHFSEIAYILDSSYLKVCILLFKARHFIRKQLASAGFRNGLRPAINLFGELTAHGDVTLPGLNIERLMAKLDCRPSERRV